MALIPAIVEFILAHSRKGRGGGGGYGGGGGKGREPYDPNKAMRKWMEEQNMKEIDNIDAAVRQHGADSPRSLIPTLRDRLGTGGAKFTPVVPGDLAPRQ